MRVLFICTANICRSPMAAALFAETVHRREIPNARVASAGFLDGGRPVHEHVATIMADRGVDLSRKRSQKVTEAVVAQADLILTMTGEHARRIVGAFPDTIDAVYTLGHFGRVVTTRQGETSTSQWLDDIHAANRRSYLGQNDELDIADPIGEKFEVFAGLAEELRTTISWIVGCAYPMHT